MFKRVVPVLHDNWLAAIRSGETLATAAAIPAPSARRDVRVAAQVLTGVYRHLVTRIPPSPPPHPRNGNVRVTSD